MNQTEIDKLALEIAKFVLPRVNNESWTPNEISQALGQAIGILVVYPLSDMIKAAEAKEQPPEEENEDEGEEGEFELKDLREIGYAFGQLHSKLPWTDVKLILEGRQSVPEWLRKEIIEKRKVK